MRKFILALLVVLFTTTLSMKAQSSDKNYFYCELVGTGKFMSNKVSVQVDFGQKTSFLKGGGDKVLKDENGKTINFNSMVDAMNYFGTQGWEFVQAYVVTTNNQNVYHWLLKKEISTKTAQELENDMMQE